MRYFLTFIYLPFLLCLFSCGNGGDGEGRCILNCNNAVLNSNVTIENIALGEEDLLCPAESPTSLLVRSYAAFRVTTTDTTDPNAEPRPAGYVRITPALYSTETDISVENLRAGGDGNWISAAWDPKILDDKDYYLRGIITPQENFCTNSCGVFEVEYTLLCPAGAPSGAEGSDVTIEARSGAASATRKTHISIQDNGN